MLVIRLTRVGKKKDASFRVVVVDSKRKVKAGNYLEMVGSYDPRIDKAELKAERITHWIGSGAKPSDTVHNLLVSQKIIDAKKINVLPSYAKTVASKAAQETAPAPAAVAPAAEATAEAAQEPEAPVSSDVAPEEPADTIKE